MRYPFATSPPLSALSGIVGLRFHRSQFLCIIKPRILNPDLSGSRATCPTSDQWLHLDWEIANHDFNRYEPLASGKPDMPNPDGSWSLLRLRVKSITTSPKFDGRWDFAILSCESWPLILPLGDFFFSKAPFYSNFLLGLFPQYHEGTIPLELVNSDSLRDFVHASRTSTSNSSQSVGSFISCALAATIIPVFLCSY
jgi:hypothetical protein